MTRARGACRAAARPLNTPSLSTPRASPADDEDDGYDYHDNYAVHLWTSADPNKREMLRHLSVRDIFTGGGSFQRVARRLLREALLAGQLCGHAAAQVRYYTEDARSDAKRDWTGPRGAAVRAAAAAAAAAAAPAAGGATEGGAVATK